MQRRTFLAGASALAVSGCAASTTSGGTPTPVTPSQVSADVSLIAQGLVNAIPLLTAPNANPGLSPATAATVQGLISDIQKAATAFTVATAATQQQTLVTQIGTALSQIATTIGPSIPAGFSGYLAAAEVLLPVVEVALGMPAPAGERIITAPTQHKMTPIEARDLLRTKPTV